MQLQQPLWLAAREWGVAAAPIAKCEGEATKGRHTRAVSDERPSSHGDGVSVHESETSAPA